MTYNGSNTTASGFRMEALNGVLSISAKGPNGQWGVWSSSALITNAAWHYVVTMSDGSSTNKFYLDGRQETVTFSKGSSDCNASDWWPDMMNASGTSNHVSIAMLHRDTAIFPFVGGIDEARCYSTTLTSNWVWASWLNIASNSVFASYGPILATRRKGTIYIVH